MLLLKNRVKILYLSQYFPPEMGAPAARVAELSRHWAKAGHDVTVLTGFPNHPTGIVPPGYRKRLWRGLQRENKDGVNVLRTWLLPFPNRKAHERMLNYGSFFFSSATTGLRLPKPDVVIATSPQLLVGLSGRWLAWMKCVPFVFEVRDLWPESLSAVGMGTEGSPLLRSLKAIADFLYRTADLVVVVTPAQKDYLIERKGLPSDRIAVITNGVEAERFDPGKVDVDLRRRLGAQEKFIVSYIGTLGMAHGLETVLEAAARLQHSFPDLLFLLIGDGAEKDAIAASVCARGLNNVRLIGERPREEVPVWICASDVCLVLLRKTELFKTVIPSKLLEFMSCARPVILAVDGQARQIVEEAGAGLFVEPGNSSALANTIARFAGDPGLRQVCSVNGRRHVVQHYLRSQTAEAYLDLLAHVCRHEEARLGPWERSATVWR